MGGLLKRSRRRFLRLIAAGSAAAAATPAAALARVVTPKRKGPGPVPGAAGAKLAGPQVPQAVAGEIRRQQALVEQALQVVRDHPLPPGSEPAFRFAPLRPRKQAGTS
jgi:hypothetical protein